MRARAMSAIAERAVWAAIFCAWAAGLCFAAPPRWGTEPSAVVTDAWADEFDLDGDKEWLGDAPISPSSLPQQSSDYEDYEDDDSEDEEEEDGGRQLDLEEEQHSEPQQSEFLFVPSRDNRLMLQDDDRNEPIKVRHTGKNPYPEVVDGDSSSSSDDESNDDSSHQFEFTIEDSDEDEDDDNKGNEVDDDDDNSNDFVLDDAPPPRKDDKTPEDNDDDDEDNFVSDGDSNNDPMFETPEEDSQVIYGDHVFLY